MPPRKKINPSRSSPSESCCVCCQPVNCSKDEVLFCAGTCQQWMHRYCAGVSVNAYKLLKDNVTPFRCFCCHQLQNNEKVSLLTDTVQELKDEIALSKKSLCTMQSSVEQPQVVQVRVTTAELDQPGQVTVMDSGTECRKSGGVHNTIANSNNRSHSSTSLISNYDRKFNIVIYGIEECPKGTPKHRRLDLDHSRVVSVLSNIDSSIKDHAIKDCFALVNSIHFRINPDQF